MQLSLHQAERVRAAYQRAKAGLLADCAAEGHWIGELSSSALSTATAVSALSLVGSGSKQAGEPKGDELIEPAVRWIAANQNDDGGWGDTQKNYSNVATTMLCVAALHLTQRCDQHAQAIEAAKRYLDRKGGLAALRRRYGVDKTFAIPILTNCALAGLVSWREVSPLPFEAACVPQKWYRFMRMPVVSYAIPALVAIGQARYFHAKPRNPLTRIIRRAAVAPSLKVLHRMQPASGGYLEAIPLTSFVVMALAGTGRGRHPVAEKGVEFLLSTVRPDGSWPIDTNLATWNTTLSLNALAGAGEDLADICQPSCLDWLLECQNHQRHPFTGADPGGWGWSDLSGAVPDADDTPGALLALHHWACSPSCGPQQRERISRATGSGVRWLLDLQNSDGGWPTFCRGWGKLPFDRSGTDLTAHVVRALWRVREGLEPSLVARVERAIERGFAYLAGTQQPDGSWYPLWFGNQDHQDEHNPVYGTAKVLLAYRDLERIDTPEARRGFIWLASCQNQDGGWGGGPALVDCGSDSGLSAAESERLARSSSRSPQARGPSGDSYSAASSSVEETALAAEAMLAWGHDPAVQSAIVQGLEWLCGKVETGLHQESSPIGFYFAKLWYYERLYPLIFTVSALGQALRVPTQRPARNRPSPPLRPADRQLGRTQPWQL